MSLPSLEEPEPETFCPDCGEEVHVVGYCAGCEDRRAREKRRESANDYRRQAQIRLDLESVRKRTRAHLGRPLFDEDLTNEDWRREEERQRVEDEEDDERRHRFQEDEPLDPEEARQNVIDAGGE